jgi:DNA-binding transcriptional regulator YhcF (GntR family)
MRADLDRALLFGAANGDLRGGESTDVERRRPTRNRSRSLVAKRDDIIHLLRERVLGGLASGRLVRGDRLSSARDVAAELGADPRVVLAAYRVLAADGLVELRERSGIFVAALPRPNGVPILSAPWVVDVLTEAVTRGVPAMEVPRWLRLTLESERLRALVVSTTIDQIAGMVGELRDSFGVEAVGIEADRVLAGGALPRGARFDFVVTTQGSIDAGRKAAEVADAPLLVTGVRTDLIGGEWRTLLGALAFVVVADPRFADTVRTFFSDTPGVDNLRVLVVGHDDLSTVPAGAPTYLTRAARERLAGTALPGRSVTSARVFDASSVREILTVVVRANLAALERRPTGDAR